jgi:hypothetical protein
VLKLKVLLFIINPHLLYNRKVILSRETFVKTVAVKEALLINNDPATLHTNLKMYTG